MKKRVTATLIVLVMLFTMLPGVASADQEYSFNTGKKINGLVNGKALAGSTISFKPYSFIESDERMMEAFFDTGDDYRLMIEDDRGWMYDPYVYVDSDGVCEISIPNNIYMAGDTFQIIFIFGEIPNSITFESEAIKTVCDLSKHGRVMDYGEPRVYNGRAQTQQVLVFYQSMGIDEGTDYTVSYKNNINVGTASVIITGKGGYIGSITKTFKITKAANLMTAQNKTVKVKASKLKNKKQVIKCSRSMGICTAVGKLQFKLVKINKKKFKKYFKVNAKNGNITIKKGLKKGTYKLDISITAAGNANYLAATKPVTVTIKVK